MTDNAETHISTEQSSTGEDSRFSRQDGDQERAPGLETAARQRAQTPDAGPLLITSQRSPAHLRNSQEFRHVYSFGKRYDGQFMTVFISSNELSFHRLGITASRKLSGKAVERNRSRRLLRESFRLAEGDLEVVKGRYDWVLNAKRSLLKVKVDAPLDELRRLVARIASDEQGFSARNTGGREL